MTSVSIILVMAVLLLHGCVSTPVQKAEVKAAREIPQGTDAKPIQFRKVVVKLRRGEPIGHASAGLLCLGNQELNWRGGKADITDDELTQAFREELQKANYPIVGDPNALFEDPSTWKAELLVAGLIDKIEANACFPKAGFGNWRDAKGGAFVQVNWQIYGQMERKVIYETKTQGSYETDEMTSYGLSKFVTNAFAGAVQNLLADPGFHGLVIRSKGQGAGTLSQPTYSAIDIDRAPRPAHGISDARAGAVTVFAGSGHGSGFIVSPSGYVLTNEHVVREARFVKVRLANGREILGDVVRSDAARDVALIKVAESNLPAMSLRLATSPNVGDDVYAIGTPLSEKLDVSVTKGIISAYRDESGLKYIQSDVQVHPGSSGGPLVDKDGGVVGIAVLGLRSGGASQNLNFFVPIGDAVSRLRLNVK